ncbi:hypothetical protein MLD63_16370 [Paracoccus sp. TK19116]|uniref:H+/citrate symporter n=1 Tax=Paracoccus albicereus TaxID=2922394 RepID=A0ABT1MUI3_9RHOB|nr:hypothetical protein [Paracoccus albicereus]MCQ0971999.1 hypothetical protein [Paracoccus albicereus]
MTEPSKSDKDLTGFMPICVMLCIIGWEYTGLAVLSLLAGLFAAATILVFLTRTSASRMAFAAIAVGLIAWAAATRGDWLFAVGVATQRGALVVALFTALGAIRTAAMSSDSILECGRFLARQRPGLRYASLTVGGHLFGLILLYGSISLLGSLAAESLARDPDDDIRRIRTRRMMVAIQRGFASTLCWSPLGFSMAITLTLVPGTGWAQIAPACIASALMMLLTGWALDTIMKPRVARPAPARAPQEGRWLVQLRPLLVLLSVVMSGVLLLHLLTGVEVIGAVMSLVPAVAIGWVALQPRPDGIGRAAWTGSRIMAFVTQDLPRYRGELVLLFMAGFIGSLGAFLLVPVLEARGLDLSAAPTWLVLVALIWVIPLTGQIGMNPILAVSLIVPLLPSAQEMGIPAVALVAAITGGWALSGTTSPFTASVLIAAALGRVTPREAGLGWNGLYTLVMGTILSLWVLLLAAA